MRFSDGEHFLAGGIGREVFDALYGPDTDYTSVEYPVNAEKLKLIYDKMIMESGCSFLFDTQLWMSRCRTDISSLLFLRVTKICLR